MLLIVYFRQIMRTRSLVFELLLWEISPGTSNDRWETSSAGPCFDLEMAWMAEKGAEGWDRQLEEECAPPVTEKEARLCPP